MILGSVAQRLFQPQKKPWIKRRPRNHSGRLYWRNIRFWTWRPGALQACTCGNSAGLQRISGGSYMCNEDRAVSRPLFSSIQKGDLSITMINSRRVLMLIFEKYHAKAPIEKEMSVPVGFREQPFFMQWIYWADKLDGQRLTSCKCDEYHARRHAAQLVQEAWKSLTRSCLFGPLRVMVWLYPRLTPVKIWFHKLSQQSNGFVLLEEQKTLSKRVHLCRDLMEWTAPEETSHRKLLQKIDFSPIYCWNIWAMSFPMTCTTSSAINSLIWTDLISRKTVFALDVTMLPGSLLRLWVWFPRNGCWYKWHILMKIGTFQGDLTCRQGWPFCIEIYLCCYQRLDGPSPNWVRSRSCLRKKVPLICKKSWKREK